MNQGCNIQRRQDCNPTPFQRHSTGIGRIGAFRRGVGMALLGSGGLELELDCNSIPRWNWNGVAWENFRIRRIGMAWRDSRKTFWDWHRIGQSEEQRRWRGVAWPFDTGEELEQNCSNPEQFSERERGVTARYANGLSTLFAIRGHLWKPGMTHLRGTSELAATFQCS